MTVKELIAALDEMPPDFPVRFLNEEGAMEHVCSMKIVDDDVVLS